MPTASHVVVLPTMTQTTSAVDTSTGPVPAWDVSDAITIAIACVNASTAPGPKVQVAFTSESTATFYFATYNTSGASPVISSSGIALTLANAGYKQLRVISTTIVTAATVHVGNKTILV